MSDQTKMVNRNKTPEIARQNVLKAVVRKRLIAMNKYSAETLVTTLALKISKVIVWDELRITNDPTYLKLLDDAIEEVMK